MTLKGEPLQVVKINGDGAVELLKENLMKLLHRQDVRDKPIAVVSVAGPFRKGKSFLLNFFIRYLSFISDEVRKAQNPSFASWYIKPCVCYLLEISR